MIRLERSSAFRVALQFQGQIERGQTIPLLHVTLWILDGSTSNTSTTSWDIPRCWRMAIHSNLRGHGTGGPPAKKQKTQQGEPDSQLELLSGEMLSFFAWADCNYWFIPVWDVKIDQALWQLELCLLDVIQHPQDQTSRPFCTCRWVHCDRLWWGFQMVSCCFLCLLHAWRKVVFETLFIQAIKDS